MIAALSALPGPALGLDAATFGLESDEWLVVSFPLPPEPSAEGLTAAEAEVMKLLLRGLSQAQIAARRGTSQRTVANQLASIYRKLGVGSRFELAARHAGQR